MWVGAAGLRRVVEVLSAACDNTRKGGNADDYDQAA